MNFRNCTPLLITLLCIVTGCVSTSTFQQKADEAASLQQSLAQTEQARKELQIAQEQCQSERDSATRQLQSCSKAAAEQKNALERAQADVARLETVLTDRSQETGKALSEMRQTIARLDDETRKGDEERKRLSAELNATTAEKTRLQQENSRLEQDVAAERSAREQQLTQAKTTYGELIDKMRQEIERGEVTISDLQGKLTVNMVERILFDSGSAEVKSGGKEVLRKVGDVLATVADKEIRVEGHSDNVPISSKLQGRFPSNWDLSAARAINVVQFLRTGLGIPGERLAACGYGEFRPLADNGTAEGRAQNRRIQIVLVPLDRPAPAP